MKIRWYCVTFASISGLLVSFEESGFLVWAGIFSLLSVIPYIKRLHTLSACLALFIYFLTGAMFFVYGHFFIITTETELTGNETQFTGTILDDPLVTSSGRQLSFRMRLENGEKIQVFYENVDTPHLLRFSSCTFTGDVDIPGTASNPYSFDYRTYLYEQRIHWVVSAKEGNVSCADDTHVILKHLRDFRNEGIRRLISEEDDHTGALMAALVFGERSYMHEDKLEQYRTFGILHLLAVSGLHVGLVTFSLFYFLYRAGVLKEHAAVIVFSFLPFYIFLAGGAPSVVRASLTCMLILLAVRFQSKLKAVDVLAVVCNGLLLINPFIIFHTGFQLSFLTSFSLLLSKAFYTGSSGILLLVKITLTAQLVSLPLILYHFYEFSLLMLPVNLIFIPFISFWVLPLSFLTVLFQWLMPPLASVTQLLAAAGLAAVEWTLDAAGRFSFTTIAAGRPDGWVMIILVLAVLLLFVLFEKEGIKAKAAGTAAVAAVLLLQIFLPYTNPEAVVTVLDVGQGDAIVIELPYRRGVYVIDTGGIVHWDKDLPSSDNPFSTGPGKYVIEPFLKGKGINKIDKLLLSHGHFDHVGEVCYLSEKFNINTAYYPDVTSFSEVSRSSLMCLSDTKVPVYWAKKGEGWTLHGNWFYIMNPEGHETNENDQSIVILAEIEGIRLLFTGDLEEEGEQRLLLNYPEVKADILKAGHHGSLTSSGADFLDQVDPSAAVISAGLNNRFSHPHPDVINRLGERGISIYRTDTDGAVEIIIRNSQYKVLTQKESGE